MSGTLARSIPVAGHADDEAMRGRGFTPKTDSRPQPTGQPLTDARESPAACKIGQRTTNPTPLSGPRCYGSASRS